MIVNGRHAIIGAVVLLQLILLANISSLYFKSTPLEENAGPIPVPQSRPIPPQEPSKATSKWHETAYNGEPFVTIFTLPKPVKTGAEDPFNHRGRQHLALETWAAAFSQRVRILVAAESIADIAYLLDIPGAEPLLNLSKHPRYGVPFVSSLFARAADVSATPYMLFINSDILVAPTFGSVLHAVAQVRERDGFRNVFATSIRYNVDVPLDSVATLPQLRAQWPALLKQGKECGMWCQDVFFYSPGLYSQGIPPYMIGRMAFDNWLTGWAVTRAATDPLAVLDVDATVLLDTLHITHPYSDLGRGSEYDEAVVINRSMGQSVYKFGSQTQLHYAIERRSGSYLLSAKHRPATTRVLPIPIS